MGLGRRQWLFYFFRVELELGGEWRLAKGGRHWGLSHMALPVIIIILLIILIISGMTFASSDQKPNIHSSQAGPSYLSFAFTTIPELMINDN